MTPLVALKVDPRDISPPVIVCDAPKVFAALSNGTLVVSTLSVTVPVVPPPVSAVPAVTPVMVPSPVPGKVWPAAKLTVPFALKEKPVSVAPLLVVEESRFSVAVGAVVSLFLGSACHSKRGGTTAFVDELKAEVYSLIN